METDKERLISISESNEEQSSNQEEKEITNSTTLTIENFIEKYYGKGMGLVEYNLSNEYSFVVPIKDQTEQFLKLLSKTSIFKITLPPFDLNADNLRSEYVSDFMTVDEGIPKERIFIMKQNNNGGEMFVLAFKSNLKESDRSKLSSVQLFNNLAIEKVKQKLEKEPHLGYVAVLVFLLIILGGFVIYFSGDTAEDVKIIQAAILGGFLVNLSASLSRTLIRRMPPLLRHLVVGVPTVLFFGLSIFQRFGLFSLDDGWSAKIFYLAVTITTLFESTLVKTESKKKGAGKIWGPNDKEIGWSPLKTLGWLRTCWNTPTDKHGVRDGGDE